MHPLLKGGFEFGQRGRCLSFVNGAKAKLQARSADAPKPRFWQQAFQAFGRLRDNVVGQRRPKLAPQVA